MQGVTMRKRQRGQAMTEFALLIPVMIMLVLGIIEFGRAFYYYSSIANAAREGARYGVVHAADQDGIRAAAVSNAVGLGLTFSNIDAQCLPSGICAFGNQVRVTVTYNFTSVAPLIPSFTMNRTATMRIESP